MLLKDMAINPSDEKNNQTKSLKDTDLQRIENVTRQLQLKRLTHPKIQNLKDKLSREQLTDQTNLGKDPNDKGQYYIFYLENA